MKYDSYFPITPLPDQRFVIIRRLEWRWDLINQHMKHYRGTERAYWHGKLENLHTLILKLLFEI